MQSRRPRLGDVVDDYCPRERRLTNHAVVAMIEDAIKQTRCSTCDFEHEYKGAKVPPRRKKQETPGALAGQVLANGPNAPAQAPAPDPAPAPAPASNGPVAVLAKGGPRQSSSRRGSSQRSASPPSVDQGQSERRSDVSEPPPAVLVPPPPLAAPDSPVPTLDQAPPGPEDGPVHRPLIRAQLPRPEGQVVVRPIPDFTVRNAYGPNGRPGPGKGQRPRSGPRGPGKGAVARNPNVRTEAFGHPSGQRGPSSQGQRPPGQGQHGQGHGPSHKSSGQRANHRRRRSR